MKTIVFDLQGTLIDHSKPPKLFSDTIACLKQLKNKFRLALVSEGEALTDVEGLLQRLGIWLHFELVLHLKGTPFQKRDGSGFYKAAEMLETDPTNIIVVGDVPLTDIKGAKVVGATAIRIRRGKYVSMEASCKEEQEDFEIKSLKELLNIVRNLKK
tara:strand:- start:17 stop:487 length:471 start_codon:yes stop_codon:yes gene_type:complete